MHTALAPDESKLARAPGGVASNMLFGDGVGCRPPPPHLASKLNRPDRPLSKAPMSSSRPRVTTEPVRP